jgi:hypothetical protein
LGKHNKYKEKGLMNYSEKLFEEQEAIRLENTIDSFFSDFQVGCLLNGAGIRKMRGASPLKVFTAIFRLPFEGKNFYRGIVERHDLGFGKDAAYGLLRNPRHNWRRLMLGLAVKIATVFSLLEREKALIFDSSTYDRSRSKKVELLAWVFDHTVAERVGRPPSHRSGEPAVRQIEDLKKKLLLKLVRRQ